MLLLRGPKNAVAEAIAGLGCLPLQHRGLTIGAPRRLLFTMLLFFFGVASAISGLLPIEIAFVSVVLLMHLFGLLQLSEIYASIDWPVIILLGAFIPIGKAMETTGAAGLVAQQLLNLSGSGSPVVVLTLLLIATMFLSDLVNNATAAVLMVPIAIKIASDLGVSPDPFLMAAAIGASCPFLTPIGHQCNALILGPGGYRFGDYWRVGLLLEVIIVLLAIPLLLLFWPF